ncbi:hypothetical protein DFH08DRAFT_901035 [Mycena albidolilacea]|uniref:Uncharacterized protein n=1 Tax=Mycena albidolilacea TaxID=1033008 RepID=A0AAD6Z4N8_9AGAR|nr:hypothetical protein DFH08DRAFT_901035 [Mycena albidolilacea]
MSRSEYTNSPLQSSLLLCFATTAPPLIPTKDLRYGSLGVVLTCLVLVAVRYIRPSTRLDRLNDTLKVATDLLSRADTRCARNIFELHEIQRDLLQYTDRHTHDFIQWLNFFQDNIICVQDPVGSAGSTLCFLEQLFPEDDGDLAETQPVRTSSTDDSNIDSANHRI